MTNEAARRYRERNREKLREAARRYREENREAIRLASVERYYNKDPEKRREKWREEQAKNRRSKGVKPRIPGHILTRQGVYVPPELVEEYRLLTRIKGMKAAEALRALGLLP